MIDQQTFHYGSSYSPLIFDEAVWDQDLVLMQRSGMNLIRLGDVHASWDRIEPREGFFEFEKLGRFYSKANDFGIKIIISTGASSPPLWLAKKHPDLPLLSNTGQRYPLGASYHWACIHHPGYQTALERYINALLEFTAQRSNHFGWQITNEIGFPFLPAREESVLGLYCYCDHCSAKFREWTKEKYQSLEAMTHAWSWGTTNYVYNDWTDVFPPVCMPAAWAGVTKWLDWRLFWQQAFAEYAGWQHQLIRQRDHDHPTSVNTFNFKGYDRFGTFMGLDQWQISKKVDHIGYDLYPGSGNKLATRPEHISIFLDHGCSVARSVGRDFWLHEIESGPIGGWVMGPDFNTRPQDLTNYVIDSLGHEVKLILYMPWREWDYQPLHWGALVDLDGNPTSRYSSALDLGNFIKNHNDFLTQARAPHGEIAILESKPNAIFFRGIDEEEQLFTAQRGAYRAFWEAGYSVDFITPEQVYSGTANQHRVIVMPMMGLMDVDLSERLAEYEKNGGTLVGFSRCGTLDSNGWYHHKLPISGLRKAFGIQRVDPDRLDGIQIEYGGEIFDGWWNRDLVIPEKETKVLATFLDGFPAVTLSAHGSGNAIYLASQCDAGHLKNSQSILAQIIKQVLPQLHIHPRIKLEYNHKKHREIDPHLLIGADRVWVLISNYLKTASQTRLSFDMRGQKAIEVKRIWPKEAVIDWSQQSDELLMSFDLNSEEVSVIDIMLEN